VKFGILLITPEGRRLLGDMIVNKRILKIQCHAWILESSGSRRS
jgi:hypothetical protein